MGIQLNEHAYQKLIDENIDALNKYMPEHSLEKNHTIEVLKWSIQQIYHNSKKNSMTKCDHEFKEFLIIDKFKDKEQSIYICGEFKGFCCKCNQYINIKN